MKRALPLILFILSPLLAEAADSGVAANAPVTNFKLSLLSDEGVRSSLLRGSEARYISDKKIDLVGMQYTTYIEDGTNEVDSTLLAPSASVFINKNKIKVHGDESVRLIRKNVDVTGERWTYDHAEKRILIEKNVRVVFSMELKDILK
jgi:lipopolysaccharide export system protein LptC